MSFYPGLDITAGVLPFLRRALEADAGGGAVGSPSASFCRFVRRVDEDLAGSGMFGDGVAGSSTGALRLRLGIVDRIADVVEGAAGGEVDVGAGAEPPGDASVDRAALDDALVTLGGIIDE